MTQPKGNMSARSEPDEMVDRVSTVYEMILKTDGDLFLIGLNHSSFDQMLCKIAIFPMIVEWCDLALPEFKVL